MRGRPRRGRRLSYTHSSHFKPQGVPLATMETVTLTAAEAEALRLADLNGKSQDEAAVAMGVSQPTFHRELKAARRKIADALLNRKAIQIGDNGGETMPGRDGTGPEGRGPRTGRGLGRCAKQTGEENETVPPRRGQGLGRGIGRGFGRRGS